MRPLRHQTLTTFLLSLLLSAGLACLIYLYSGQLPWQLAVASSGLVLLVIGLALEVLLYGPARRMHRRLRTALGRNDGDGPRLHLAQPRGNPITALYGTILKATGAMRREYAELRKIEMFRREFLGDVSHELKTPIFAIQGFIETLLDGALEDKKVNRKFLRKALRNVFRLEALVQDLLTISQLETGELRMEMTEFKPYDLVLDVFETTTYKRKKEGQKAELRLRTNNLENQYVRGDRARISQVVENLVNNAIQYGRDEDAWVEVVLAMRGANGKRKMVIEVRDNGKGIAEEHLEHIFERFYRIDKSRSREMGGTGLGLSIVKYLLEAHGEEIEVESTLDVGTTFRFTLAPVIK
ncbi:MAG: cell wall metabolism sensor histidine kinase WalK [Bacteroidetes bacterium]|jgi:two-component system phosphate regulon sensor histidine kinase PhoR|nr:cell wall metabolism sensor histidine kinase WalK [Bacteroidota bacterium]